eukprot:240047_1
MASIDVTKLKAEDIDNILDEIEENESKNEIEEKESKNETETNWDEILNQLRKTNISFIKHAISSFDSLSSISFFDSFFSISSNILSISSAFSLVTSIEAIVNNSL